MLFNLKINFKASLPHIPFVKNLLKSKYQKISPKSSFQF